MDYEPVIGLEVHAQLSTRSKIFCSCSSSFSASPNVNVCPVCFGLPGTLPVLNRNAVNYAIKAALAFGCRIAKQCLFHRKNYFYPDLPKNYQISQYDSPLAEDGYVKISLAGSEKKIRLSRIHLEEDAGKLVHLGRPGWNSGVSLVDYNRCGVPLLEIVTRPDLSSPEEAREFLHNLKTTLNYLGISDCKMEEGSLRCDANISLREKGSAAFGTRVEIKNMNSFRAVYRALEFEIDRQSKILLSGGKLESETRLWDEKQGRTLSMRGKEETHDYRYFPEPDLVPLEIDDEWIEEIRKTLPELPEKKRERYRKQYDIPEYDIEVLTADPSLAVYFEKCMASFDLAKLVSNWIMVELKARLNEDNISIAECPVTPEKLVSLLEMIRDGTISGKIAKEVFSVMYETGKTAPEIVKEKGLVQISDQGELEDIVDSVIRENPKVVEQVRSGKTKAIGALVGQVMKKTGGRANPGLVNRLLQKKIL